MMRINVNGQDHQVAPGSTVAALVELLKLQPQRIAVERNRRLVRRATFAATALTDGDVLEIVTLVGGG